MPSKRRRSSSISSASSWTTSSASSSRSSSPSSRSSSSASSASPSSGYDSEGSSTDEDEEKGLEGKGRHHHRRARRRESSRERRRRRRREHRKNRRRRHHKDSDKEEAPSSGMSTTLLWSIVAVLVVLGALVIMILVINKTSSSSASVVLSTSVSGTRTVVVTHTNSASASKATGGATATAAASGAASSLAALSSMTAASISTLPMPTAAISDPNKTVDYIQSDWNWLGGGSQYLTFVEEPFDGSDIVLAIEYPKGSYSGSDSVGGGVGAMHLDIYGDTAPSRSIISYDLVFSEDFNFMAGGKLPGAFGGYRADHCTGGRMTTACFSLRLMWRTDGAGEVYGYIPTAPSQCEGKTFLCHGGNAISIERGSFNFTAGVWQTVTEVAVLNSDPKEDGTVANGELSLYLNDVLAFSLTDVVFRTNASVFFSSFLISSFFGGSTANYESQGGFSYFKNFQFFSGSDPSDASGDTIAAAVNTTSGDDS